MPALRSYADFHTPTTTPAVKKPRRRLKRIEITKIDAVDRPAQQPAKAVMLKRDDQQENPDMSNQTEIQKAVASVLEDYGITKADENADEGDLTEQEAEAYIGEVEDAFLDSVPESVAEEYNDLSPEEQLEVLRDFDADPEESVEKLAKAAEDAEEVQAEIEEGDEAGEITIGDVLASDLSAEEKVDLIGQLTSEPGVTEEDLGELADVTKGYLDEEIAKRDAEIENLRYEADLAKAVNVADEMLPFLPGSSEEKGELLMALDSLPREVQGTFAKALASTNELNSQYYEEAGTSLTNGDGMAKSATDKVQETAQKLADKKGIPLSKAIVEVLHNTPEGDEAYRISKAEAHGDRV